MTFPLESVEANMTVDTTTLWSSSSWSRAFGVDSVAF